MNWGPWIVLIIMGIGASSFGGSYGEEDEEPPQEIEHGACFNSFDCKNVTVNDGSTGRVPAAMERSDYGEEIQSEEEDEADSD